MWVLKNELNMLTLKNRLNEILPYPGNNIYTSSLEKKVYIMWYGIIWKKSEKVTEAYYNSLKEL